MGVLRDARELVDLLDGVSFLKENAANGVMGPSAHAMGLLPLADQGVEVGCEMIRRSGGDARGFG